MLHTFETLQVDPRLIHRLKENGIEHATDVQAGAIPVIMEGRNVAARSQTGTGKTLAYLLPILQSIDSRAKDLQAIILAPTQELAMQIFREAETYGEALGITGQALIGGASLKRQLEKLKEHPQLIVGTPGRILELIEMRKLKMHKVATIVIDEADHIFAADRKEGEAEQILRRALRDCQVLLFSATLPSGILEQTKTWMENPAIIGLTQQQKPAAALEHHVVICEERDKIDTVRRAIYAYKPESGIIFANHNDQIKEIGSKLQHVGLDVGMLYGETSKQERTAVMKNFREGRLHLLLATDVAARGLDLQSLTHVFLFDPAVDQESYLHRAGRTGRMGQKGVAVSFIDPKQEFIIRKLSKSLNISFQYKQLQGGEVREARSRPSTRLAGQVSRSEGTQKRGRKPR